MKKKLVPITVLVPECAFKELQAVANEREWSISHLVRFLILGTLDAWLRQDFESFDDGQAHEK